MQKITSWSKLYIDCNDYGTVYVFWLLVLYVNRQKIYIPPEYYRNNRPSPIKKREEGHLISGYHSQEMSASQWSEKAGIQCSQEYPIFTFYFNCMTY